MNYLLRMICLSLACALVGCASSRPQAALRWSKSEVPGLTIALDDRVKEEWYSFSGGGFVSVTYGEKKGWLTAPLLRWKIQGERLIIYKVDKTPFQELTLISQDEKTLTVKDKAGKVVIFKKQNA
jgi:hypothetical protein